MIRSPICVLMGHVDHGKTTILDNIRGTAIANAEAGGITQAIGASIVPIDVLRKVCGNLLDALKLNLTLPSILFIDSPGHAAFTNLRRRGGNLADIAILVVDINEGLKPQTEEAIEILRKYKTPFIIAANKVDIVHGWTKKDMPLISSIGEQTPDTMTNFETKLYKLIGQIYEKFQLDAERFDRVEDYTKQIAIVPCSAKTKEGLPEVLMVLTGLAQKYLEECLECDVSGNAKGTILEVKEEKGLGKTVDLILYDGSLKVNDTIVIGGLEQPIVTKVRALFEPAPLAEMRDKKSKFQSVKEVSAATGVKVSAPEIEDVISGAPIHSCKVDEIEATKSEVQKEVEEVVIETEKDGIIVKADSLGSLEALVSLLKERGVQIRRASVGDVTKKDISDAESNHEKDPLTSVILGFSINATDEMKNLSGRVQILTSDVIYSLIDDFEKWQQEELKRQEAKELDNLVRPCKIQVMEGYVFRQSNPAIAGCEILNGKAKVGIPIITKDGRLISEIKSIQAEKDTVNEAEKGKQVAIAMPNVTIGRQVNEGDILYSGIPEEDFKQMKKLKKYLSPDEVIAIKEIAEIMREKNPLWGV